MKIKCEVSVRHVHLSQKDLESLFGAGAELEFVRELSQPGQFLSAQKVDLIGPKRSILGVSVLGPCRAETQVEISRTDCFTLGIKDVPVRQSGMLQGSPGIILKNGDNQVQLTHGVVVAQRHVHMHTDTAKKEGFVDGDMAELVIEGERGGVLSNAVVRVNPSFGDSVHLDSDEGNGLGFKCGTEITIRKMGK